MMAVRQPLRFLRRQLPPFNFITLHYTYFIVTCLLSAIILWGSSTPARSLSFTDSLFLAVSAMSLAGLNTVNLSTLNTFQQIVLFLLLLLGSAIFVSAFVVHVRKARFEQKFISVVESQRQKKRGRRRSRSRGQRSNFSLSRRRPISFAEEESNVQEERKIGDDGTSSEQQAEGEMNNGPPTASEKSAHVPSSPQAVPSPDRASGINTSTGARPANDDANGTHATGIQFRIDPHPDRGREGNASGPNRRFRHSLFNAQGVGARSTSSLRVSSTSRSDLRSDRAPYSAPPESHADVSRYFNTVSGWISRNSQFHGLTPHEREKLGGYEYRAVKILSWLVPAYFILWQLLACIGCAAWVALNRADAALVNGLNPWWVGAFNAVSAFNNSGMSLLDANMTAFQTGYYLLITMGLLVLAGNTCYPIFLRLIVWTMYRLIRHYEDASDYWAEHARTLKFLLDHPRRCYTNLFPSRHTWWLLVSVITLNGIDWAAFEILNIGNKQITLPTNVRVIDGLFQAVAVRSGGFYVVPISSVRIGLQVLYVVMMYISVYPVVITMRNSNVYEERSLGIYAEDEEDSQGDQSGNKYNILRKFFMGKLGAGAATTESNRNFVRQQLRAQLAHDAWTIVLALFFIMIIETSQFDRDPINFSVFNFLFEIVSAYGCVGISVGIPWADYSFCGTWHTLSKLILCLVMLRGRHRGLPVAIDKAVLLPGEANEEAEEDDGRIRLARTMSRDRQVDGRILATV